MSNYRRGASERGATMIEMAFLLGLILLVCFIGVRSLGLQTNQGFCGFFYSDDNSNGQYDAGDTLHGFGTLAGVPSGC